MDATINPCNAVPSTIHPTADVSRTLAVVPSSTTIVASLCPEETIKTLPSTTVALKIGNKTIYDHCTESPYNMDKMFLQLAPATVPDDIFPMLHHPGTPASMSFVMTQGQSWPAHKPIQTACSELYLTRTGSRSSQPNKCVAIMKVPIGVESGVQSSYRYGFTALLTNQYRNDYPTEKTFHEELVLMPPLLKVLASLQAEFKKKMGNPLAADGTRRAVIVMVANEGVMDLALNYICSAEDSGIDLKSIMVFVGSEQDLKLVENMGAQGLYSTALGSMPKAMAEFYLDNTFSRMMWFKTTSVFLATSCGFDALFQDVDLVWTQNPIPYLRSLDADISFMDDGARTPRYTPFFVNSGFYFVKYNARTMYFQEKMMKTSACEIGRTHSHQSVLIRHIAESHHLFGLKVMVLHKDLFPSGEAYHERKPYLNKVIARTYAPYVFHMCWTDNKLNKIVYFKNTNIWYVNENITLCNDGAALNKYASSLSSSSGKNVRDKCCVRSRYWWKNVTTEGWNALR